MKIEKSIDIEDAVREALEPYMSEKIYVHELPKKLKTPCVRVMRTGGTRKNGIDVHMIALQYRAKTDAEAELLANTTNAIFEAVVKQGDTPLRACELISHGNWGADPSRPDLAMRQAAYNVATHVIIKEV